MKGFVFFLSCFALVLAEDELSAFLSGSREFTGAIYNQLLVDNKENIVVSPFSAETVLALTQSGAKGDTGAEIRTGLHLPDTEEDTEVAIKSVLPTIQSEYCSLVTANKIYVEKEYAIKEDFKRVATDVYQAQFENIEFAKSVDAASEINKWVEEQTNDKIHELVNADDLDADTKIVLVNALYFQGNWSVPFDPILTKQVKFYTSTEASVDAPTMYKESEQFNYYESEELDAQVLEIPFMGEEATMTFVLPNKKEGIAILEKQIDKVLETPKYTKEWVQVLLPKFKVESTIDFKPLLEKLGVEKAFDLLEADFSGIAGEKGELAIASVSQKTYIDVNEIGVEAAAATEIGGFDSLPPAATKVFVADHPFVFYIKIHDVILFEGRVLVPEYES
jgi:serpin B